MKKEQGYDYLIKLLIIGNSGVGKTNLLMRFSEDSFMTSHLTTIGIDFKTKSVYIGSSKIRMQIWDTAGQQRFKTITQTYYRGAMGIVLTYSVEDRASFEDIQNWMKQIKMHANDDVVKILVGNKCDSSKRVISFEEGRKMAEDLGMEFWQTSAKDDINVDECFMKIGEDVVKRLQSNDAKGKEKDGAITNRGLINQTKSIFKKKRKCC